MDDADTPAVADLAAEFGFDYIVRPDRGVMKKAGNLRNAFDNILRVHAGIGSRS